MAEAQYTYSDIERHPLQPFLPPDAQILMLGSFPPPKERWCMDFFYPNPQNDMWRIIGLVFFGDKTNFEVQRDDVRCTKGEKKVFDREKIVAGSGGHPVARQCGGRTLGDSRADRHRCPAATDTVLPQPLLHGRQSRADTGGDTALCYS